MKHVALVGKREIFPLLFYEHGFLIYFAKSTLILIGKDSTVISGAKLSMNSRNRF